MRTIVVGKVVEVQPRSYVNRQGVQVDTFDAYIASDNPRYGASRVSGPIDLVPVVGEEVQLDVRVNARVGKDGSAYVTYWAVG